MRMIPAYISPWRLTRKGNKKNTCLISMGISITYERSSLAELWSKSGIQAIIVNYLRIFSVGKNYTKFKPIHNKQWHVYWAGATLLKWRHTIKIRLRMSHFFYACDYTVTKTCVFTTFHFVMECIMFSFNYFVFKRRTKSGITQWHKTQ